MLYLTAFTGCSPLGHSGTNRFLPWGPWGGTSWGCCILATFIASFLPHGPEASLAPPRGPGQWVPSCPGREAPWGTPWRPPGIACISVFETSPYLPGQSTLLVPVPTGPHLPWHLPADMMGEAVGKLSGRKLVVPGDRTGQESTQLPHSFFLGCINYLVSFIFFSDRVALCT